MGHHLVDVCFARKLSNVVNISTTPQLSHQGCHEEGSYRKKLSGVLGYEMHGTSVNLFSAYFGKLRQICHKRTPGITRNHQESPGHLRIHFFPRQSPVQLDAACRFHRIRIAVPMWCSSNDFHGFLLGTETEVLAC